MLECQVSNVIFDIDPQNSANRCSIILFNIYKLLTRRLPVPRDDRTKKKTAIIIGAGPAGLTAAYELLHKTDVHPIVFEMSDEIGGISRTINYKGNRMDIGGHRFFSKSDRVMAWWNTIMPIQGAPSSDDKEIEITYQGKSRHVRLNPDGPDPEKTDKVMLIRHRLSRIFYLRKFFSYPVNLSAETIMNLGFMRVAKIGASYTKARVRPIKHEQSLEDFFINRFGRELYLTFFKVFTENVWGKPCDEISAEWGAQLIKGLSISKAVIHAMKSVLKTNKRGDVAQKNVETSLIEHFFYPKFGPGQMWEEVARQVTAKGGEVIMHHRVVSLDNAGGKIKAITVEDTKTGKKKKIEGDYFFSTMPISELIADFEHDVPKNVSEVASGLEYRDFMTVGLLLTKLKIKNTTDVKTLNNLVPDNWIYIQERDVKIGRLQIFNNWSPYMVKDKNTVWLGLEYFCNEGDELWTMDDKKFIAFAIDELEKIDIIDPKDVLDHTLVRVPKTYPGYFGTYDRFDEIRTFTDGFENLFLIGRNGMHKYNNQDHSMLSAMVAVENIIENRKDKDNVWAVNAEGEYHETKS